MDFYSIECCKKAIKNLSNILANNFERFLYSFNNIREIINNLILMSKPINHFLFKIISDMHELIPGLFVKLFIEFLKFM